MPYWQSPHKLATPERECCNMSYKDIARLLKLSRIFGDVDRHEQLDMLHKHKFLSLSTDLMTAKSFKTSIRSLTSGHLAIQKPAQQQKASPRLRDQTLTNMVFSPVVRFSMCKFNCTRSPGGLIYYHSQCLQHQPIWHAQQNNSLLRNLNSLLSLDQSIFKCSTFWCTLSSIAQQGWCSLNKFL